MTIFEIFGLEKYCNDVVNRIRSTKRGREYKE